MAANTASALQPAAAHVPATVSDPSKLDRHHRRTAAGLLVLFLFAIAVIVFWPGQPDPGGQSALKAYLNDGPSHGLPSWVTFALVETVANVAMFMPVGLLGSLAIRARNYLVIGYAALASGLIELVQLVLLPQRVASLDDIRANTMGAILGFLISVPALRARRRRRRRYREGRVGARDSKRLVALTVQR
jgi:hypothetical protein